MAIRVIMAPDLGEGTTEVELVAWRVAVGDRVREEQVLADLMTDKATVELPSPFAGKVLALSGAPGDRLAVGSELARIEVDAPGDEVQGPGDRQDDEGVAARAPPPPPPPPPPPTPTPTPTPTPIPSPFLSAESVGGSVATQRVGAARATASPAVRKRASDLGIDLRNVRGTGPDGRVMHADLDALLVRGGAVLSPAIAAERSDEHPVRVVGVRRRIAERMQDAKRRIPHFTYVEEIDVTELEILRARLNEMHATGRGHLTLLPLLVRSVARAVRDHPEVNARFDDAQGVVVRHGAVHVGIATQTDAGLMVPVVRHAEALDPWACAAEIARLAGAARALRATADELSGATITITSLGPLGGIVTTPVINPPEVAIVGVGRIVERPVVRAGAIVARRMMNLSSSFDHRVVDGVVAARFVQAVRCLLETPALLFVD